MSAHETNGVPPAREEIGVRVEAAFRAGYAAGLGLGRLRGHAEGWQACLKFFGGRTLEAPTGKEQRP